VRDEPTDWGFVSGNDGTALVRWDENGAESTGKAYRCTGPFLFPTIITFK